MTQEPGRNDPCPCGSGRKYKYCCLNKNSTNKNIIAFPVDTAGSTKIPTRTGKSDFWKEVVEDHLGQEMANLLKEKRLNTDEGGIKKEPTLEENSLTQAHSYQSVLWGELNDLVFLYLSLCRKHQHQQENAVARALLFTIFGAIEAQNRVLACCALLANSYVKKGDGFDSDEFDGNLQQLSYTEVLYLRQETEEIDSSKFCGKIKQKFVSFEAALIGYPIIYGRIFGFNVSIDKSASEWQNLMSLKKLRDLGAHGNIQIHQGIDSSVTFDDLVSLLQARKWYCSQLKDLPWIGGIEARGEQFAIKELLERLGNKHEH